MALSWLSHWVVWKSSFVNTIFFFFFWNVWVKQKKKCVVGYLLLVVRYYGFFHSLGVCKTTRDANINSGLCCSKKKFNEICMFASLNSLFFFNQLQDILRQFIEIAMYWKSKLPIMLGTDAKGPRCGWEWHVPRISVNFIKFLEYTDWNHVRLGDYYFRLVHGNFFFHRRHCCCLFSASILLFDKTLCTFTFSRHIWIY